MQIEFRDLPIEERELIGKIARKLNMLTTRTFTEPMIWSECNDHLLVSPKQKIVDKSVLETALTKLSVDIPHQKDICAYLKSEGYMVAKQPVTSCGDPTDSPESNSNDSSTEPRWLKPSLIVALLVLVSAVLFYGYKHIKLNRPIIQTSAPDVRTPGKVDSNFPKPPIAMEQKVPPLVVVTQPQITSAPSTNSRDNVQDVRISKLEAKDVEKGQQITEANNRISALDASSHKGLESLRGRTSHLEASVTGLKRQTTAIEKRLGTAHNPTKRRIYKIQKSVTTGNTVIFRR